MEYNCLPKLAQRYNPHGKREIGRPRRKWIEPDHLKASEVHRTGLCTYNVHDDDDDDDDDDGDDDET